MTNKHKILIKCDSCGEIVDSWDKFVFRGKTFNDGRVLEYNEILLCFKCQSKIRIPYITKYKK